MRNEMKRSKDLEPRPVRCLARSWLAPAFLWVAACDNVAESPDGGTTAVECPGPLPTAAVTCTAPACTATSGMKSFGEADLAADKGKSWFVVAWATSEVAASNENTSIDYTKSIAGALSARWVETGPRSIEEIKRVARERAEAFMTKEAYDHVFSPERIARVKAEAAIRAMQYDGPFDFSGVSGTAIRGRTDEIVPAGVHRQSASCTSAAPSCGSTSLCVIPEGTTSGTCEGTLRLKFRTGSTTFDTVNATVRKVGQSAAVVVDDATTVSAADVDEIIKRFDEHIAPLDHQFFGKPQDRNGKDRDGNGVVILFLTSRVTSRGDASLVGYFEPDDLLPSSMAAHSNAADILYMQGPGTTITLNALSGTIGHEYQHLINYYAKRVLAGSSAEEVWLDEGLASFAEDMLGYGGDAFLNIAAYLMSVDQTSLTGAGFQSTEDNNPRRGMAHLLVRYLFEQAGGAAWGQGPASVTDKGGIAAVKKLVSSADTGSLLFTREATGRTFHEWVGDVMTTAAIDGASYAGVSCNPKYSLRAPETDAYTNYPRGIDLRSSFVDPKGTTIRLNGPATPPTLEMESVPVPTNGGEVRTVQVTAGSVKIGVSGAADYDIGFRAFPTAP